MRVSNPVTVLFFALVAIAQLPSVTATRFEQFQRIDQLPVTINYLEKGIGRDLLDGQSARKSAGLVTLHRDPDEVWQEIKSLAEGEAASPSRPYIHPLTIESVGSTLKLKIQSEETDDLGFGDDPYQLPFKRQILIEVLRRFFTEKQLERSSSPKQNRSPSEASATGSSETIITDSNPNAQWQSYLDQAQHLVRQTVVEIETVTDKKQLKQLLVDAKEQIDHIIYRQLFDSVAKYAEEHHYVVLNQRGGRVKLFSVPLVCIPEGCKIWLMTDLVYKKQFMVRTDPTQWPWLEMLQNPADLIGKYRYRASWPDGRHVEDNIVVTNSNPLRFQP